MKLATKLLTLTAILFFASCEELENGLTDDEIVRGLKEALEIGTDNSVLSASAVGGYLENEAIKILLPPEVQALKDEVDNGSIDIGITSIPYSTIMDAYVALNPNVQEGIFEDLIVAMNRGAENAADKALPIFGDAIATMSIQDGLQILQGNETAATDYFYDRTNQDLFNAFQPDVRTALNQSGAVDLYDDLIGFLNFEYDAVITTIKVSDVINTGLPESIDGYATTEAIDGLFFLVGEEEKKIREDPFAWGSSIIEKVFGSPEAGG